MAVPHLQPLDGALPQNIEAEQAVLGSCLIDVRAITRIAPFLRPEDFYLPVNAELYRGMLSLAERNIPTDVIMLIDWLQSQNRPEDAGGAAYLASLASIVPTSLHAEHYARIVHRLATSRRMIDAGTDIVKMGYDEQVANEERLPQAEARLQFLKGVDSGQSYAPTPEAWDSLYEQLSAPPSPANMGVMTGLVSIDKICKGFRRGQMTVLAAATGVGKTSLAVTIAHYAAVTCRMPVLFFAIEMVRDDILTKTMSLHSGVTHDEIISHRWGPATRERLNTARAELRAAPLHIIPGAGWTAAQVITEVRKYQQRHPEEIRLVIVDYLQWLSSGERRENQNMAITEMVKALKQFALEENMPLLLLSSVNRPDPNRPARQPDINSLRDSGSIGHTAEVVWLMWRDADDPEGQQKPQNAVTEVWFKVEKNRMGESHRSVKLGLRGAHMQFVELSRETPTRPDGMPF